MKYPSMTFSALFLLLLSACGSVHLPEQNYYRLLPPQALGAASRDQGYVLRVQSVRLASSLAHDRLMVSHSPVRLQAYEFHNWVSPLDQMVEDVLITGLSRQTAFLQVKDAGDGYGEDLCLNARILDFHQVQHNGQWSGRVSVAVNLCTSKDQHSLLQEEFSATVPMQGSDPDALVLALSSGLSTVMTDMVARCEEELAQHMADSQVSPAHQLQVPEPQIPEPAVPLPAK